MPSPVVPPVDDTLGAALVGFTISSVILGLILKEVFTYYRRYPNDRTLYKVMVGAVGILEMMEDAFIGHFLYYYMVSNYTNPAAFFIDDFVWSLMLPVVIGAMVGTIVKLCFAMRVWRFSDHNIFITGLIVILTFSQLGLGITYAIKSYGLKKLAHADQLKLIASLSLGSGALTDTITAVTLCYYLRKFRTGYGKSQQLVYKLSLYAVNTGTLTSIMSLGALIFYNARPRTFQFTPFYYTLSRLYALSLLCTLNTRREVQGHGTDRGASSASVGNHSLPRFVVNYSSRHSQLPPVHQASNTKEPLEIGVQVHHEVSFTSDPPVTECYDPDHVNFAKGPSSPTQAHPTWYAY